MLRVLLKKQLAEVFKSYFYDAKKNKMRSKGAIVAWIVFFVVVMVGMLGGMFTVLSLSLCGSMTMVGMGWLYFVLMCGIAILLGAFGSVFNTYAGLYLGKDNDLLLSMPIPVRTILTARLANVYLMGTMYSATVLIPTIVVYWIVAGVTAARVICGVLLFVIVTTIVLLLSCALGWVVAKISLKLKNKSFITVVISLVFIAAYYFFYFKANGFIQNLVANAESYGEKVKGSAYVLYLFGRIGEGDWLATVIFTAVTALLFGLTCWVLSRSFLKIATSSGGTAKVRYTEKTVKGKSAFGALLGKELSRFTSSANYMLNCGLGILLLPVGGVALLIKGRMVCEALDEFLAGFPNASAVILCGMFFMAASMNDMATPSVSLEGKSIWIPQSLPVAQKLVLRAKMSVQLILSGAPMLFAAICAAIVLPASVPLKLLVILTALVHTAFSAIAGTVIGLKMPLLNWTNEQAPIKQSGAVMIALFGGWILCIVFIGLYLLFGHRIGAALYLLAWSVLLAAASLILLRWMDTKGAALFASL